MSAILTDAAKIGIPIVLGLLVWFTQTLAQRAWDEYENRRALYLDIVRYSEGFFVGGAKDDKREFLRAIRRSWLVASDEVVRAANELTMAMQAEPPLSEDRLAQLFQVLMDRLRRDLRQRRWLPPTRTSLTPSDFRIETPS